MKKHLKKILTITLAMVLVLSMSAVAFADDTSAASTTTEVSGNVYVTAEDNPFSNLLTQLTGGTTAYLTNDSLFPTNPASGNAKMTTDGNTWTVSIPIENIYMSWIQLGNTTAESYASTNVSESLQLKDENGNLVDGAYVQISGTENSGYYTDNHDGVRISSITATFTSDPTGNVYVISPCTEHPYHKILGDKNVQNIDLHLLVE